MRNQPTRNNEAIWIFFFFLLTLVLSLCPTPTRSAFSFPPWSIFDSIFPVHPAKGMGEWCVVCHARRLVFGHPEIFWMHIIRIRWLIEKPKHMIIFNLTQLLYLTVDCASHRSHPLIFQNTWNGFRSKAILLMTTRTTTYRLHSIRLHCCVRVIGMERDE